MSNRTYVCLDCRTAKRAKAAYGLVTDFRCSKCGHSLAELDWRRRIPRKDDDKAWKALRVHVAKLKLDWEPQRTKIGLERLTKIDRKIAATKRAAKRTPADDKLRSQVQSLQLQRRTTAKRYNLS